MKESGGWRENLTPVITLQAVFVKERLMVMR